MIILFYNFFILSILAPLVLIPVETILPYPYIVEEIVKFMIVVGFSKSNKEHIFAPILGGFLFSLTETFLYIPNIMAIGQPHIIFERIFITGGMHVATILLMYLGLRKKTVIGIAALILSIMIHYFFNKYSGLFLG